MRDRPLVRVALTGGIATGKSHCLRQFAALGAPVIDADVLAKQAIGPATQGREAVIARFGRDVLDASGEVDRTKLARVIFSDAGARRDLEAIVHPAVYRAIAAWFDGLERRAGSDGSGPPAAIADVPLLFETNRAADFDRIVVAACPPALQRERLLARDGLTGLEIEQRLAAQMPIDEKRRRADFVIDTGGTFDETDRQVAGVWKALV